jgi:hypothetical protein
MVKHTFKGHAEAGRSEGSRGMTGTNPMRSRPGRSMRRRWKRRSSAWPRTSRSSCCPRCATPASDAMSYFTKGQADPARLVQSPSSGMKNVMPSYLITIDRSLTRSPGAPTSVRRAGLEECPRA